MSNYYELEKAVNELNNQFPRPDLVLKLEKMVTIKTNSQWQNATKPGIYAIFSETSELLYIGKASMSSNIGYRIGAKYSSKTFESRNTKFSEGTQMATIALPEDRSFEAPSIEEFLIKKLNPKLNAVGKD